MRVIGGALKGRRLDAPSGTATRPTADRVREALFSRLQSLAGDLTGLSVLDAYAGSGALGIEAISRGAGHATFVDSSRRACDTVRKNVRSVGLQDRTNVICADIRSMAKRSLPGEPFGLLFLDPPYRIRKSEVRGVVQTLQERGALAEGGLVVWEHAADTGPEWPEGFEDLGPRTYGSTHVSIARAPDFREA